MKRIKTDRTRDEIKTAINATIDERNAVLASLNLRADDWSKARIDSHETRIRILNRRIERLKLEWESGKPSAEQIAALVKYAQGNGRSWKSKLNNDWMYARTQGTLQGIRNEFGPSWLAKFKLPKEDK